MSYAQKYAGAIWTNHALERLSQRKLPQQMAADAFKNPDKSFPGKQSGTTEFLKRIGKYKVTVIGKKNEHYEWVILSCWVDPPFSGSIDVGKKERYLEYRKAGILKRVWMDLKYLIGLK